MGREAEMLYVKGKSSVFLEGTCSGVAGGANVDWETVQCSWS